MSARMTVAAYFHFDGKTRSDANGSEVQTTWQWAMGEFDRVAAAADAVRSVVLDQSYVLGMPVLPTPPNSVNATDVRAKLQHCRAAGQLVYGYVAGSGGAVPLNRPQAPPDPTQTWWHVPRDRSKWWVPLTGAVTPTAPPANQYPDTVNGLYPCVRDQIDAWFNLYADYIDGIYVDEGPTDCMNAITLGRANIPDSWKAYCDYIHTKQRPAGAGPALAYLLSGGYADEDPNKPQWFQTLPFDDVAVFEQQVPMYESWTTPAFDPCNPAGDGSPGPVAAPAWWNGGAANAIHRIHIINGGVLTNARATAPRQPVARVLAHLLELAESRGCQTAWITETQTSAHGSVYGFLPPYWDSEVALCRPVAAAP